MNMLGSYRQLLKQSNSAVYAAIEIYNKPKFEYREEVFSTLIVSAWELLMLAILSKNRTRIFAPKKRNEDYRTISFDESIKRSKKFLPSNISVEPFLVNIKLLRKFRNISSHYYHDEKEKQVIYFLAQTSIINYKEIVECIFGVDISAEITTILLPLSFNTPPDFIKFIQDRKKEKHTPFVKELLKEMSQISSDDINSQNRLVIPCLIKFEPIKNRERADVTAVRDSNHENGAVVERVIGIDDSHPFIQKTIIGRGNTPAHKKLEKNLTPYQFQAIVKCFNIKLKTEYCYCSKLYGSPRYSPKMIEFLNGLSEADIKKAVECYRNFNKQSLKT